DATRALTRVTLVAHLRDDLVLARQSSQETRLVHGPRERLLAVDVFLCAHRRRGDRRVHVIRRCDDDAVEILLLRQHLAEIGVLGGLLVLVTQRNTFRARLASGRGRTAVAHYLALHVAGVDVAERDEVLAR